MNEMTLSPGFQQWIKANGPEVEQVQSLLSEPLSDNPAVLASQLSKIEAWHARMTTFLAEANAFLDRAECAALLTRSSGEWTDLDRRTHLRAEVIHERRMRDVIDGLCKSIETRLILGMSLSKRNAGERSDW